jgi:uncharacterized membrane protein YdbT with pleckstrin-like domain
MNVKYVRSSLVSGEKLEFAGEIHYVVMLAPVLILGSAILNLAICYVLSRHDGIAYYWGGFCKCLCFVLIIYGVVELIKDVLTNVSTEIGITNRRIILKTGIISRKIIELSHQKIEGINIYQAFWGRIFGYGTVTFTGTGTANEVLNYVKNPMLFRKKAFDVANRINMANQFAAEIRLEDKLKPDTKQKIKINIPVDE